MIFHKNERIPTNRPQLMNIPATTYRKMFVLGPKKKNENSQLLQLGFSRNVSTTQSLLSVSSDKMLFLSRTLPATKSHSDQHSADEHLATALGK